jgi:hypothetical protein
MMGVLWEVSFWHFLWMTCILGGAGSALAGRAVALAWRPWWRAIPHVLLLTFGVRFLSFGLWQETLASAHFAAVTFLLLALTAAIGWRLAHVSLMVRQYPWLYRRTSLFTWTTI